MHIDAERLAYWYLRLNGFLTTVNFVVHPDTGSDQRTDVDLLGVRFPYRAENLLNPMKDDEAFSRLGEKTLVVFVEVKAGAMQLNGPWTQEEKDNMSRVLRAVGPLPPAESDLASRALYSSGGYRNQLYHVCIVCMGDRNSDEIQTSHPDVLQITWRQALTFIHRRFRGYRNQKRSHGQWDEDGRNLWDAAQAKRNVEEFVSSVRITA
jgi:hypothetical protein